MISKKNKYDDLLNSMAFNMAQQIDKEFLTHMSTNPNYNNSAYPPAVSSYISTSATTTTAGNSVVVGGAQGTTIGTNYINLPTYTSPVIAGGNTSGYGTIATDGTGNLTWNGNPLQHSWNQPSVSRVTDMLKDSLTREIILCKDREECAKKYGEYGLKFFDSMLKEIIEEAIKSEEAFTKRIQELTDRLEGAEQE